MWRSDWVASGDETTSAARVARSLAVKFLRISETRRGQTSMTAPPPRTAIASANARQETAGLQLR